MPTPPFFTGDVTLGRWQAEQHIGEYN